MMKDSLQTSAPRKKFPLLAGGLVFLIVIGLLVILAVQMKASKVTSLEVGQPIRDFSITTFDGQEITLSEQAGKVVLLNFWSSWCASCDEEGAALEQVWQELKSDGEILFLGVNYVDTDKDSLAFLERYAITYPNGADLGSRIANYFKVDAVPETYLINPDGSLAAIQIGPFESADQVREFLALAKE
jgi:cytochrome c biogenesis protein CcmG/thiol:disulfide interchange protein DsbE